MLEPKRFDWKLRVMMAECNITTATELKRRLEAYGYEITASQLTRIISKKPKKIDTEMLEIFSSIFNCELSDILRPVQRKQQRIGS